jgi:hypothetical protein
MTRRESLGRCCEPPVREGAGAIVISDMGRSLPELSHLPERINHSAEGFRPEVGGATSLDGLMLSFQCKCYLGSLRLLVPTLCGIYDAENRGGCIPSEDRRNEEMRYALNRGKLRSGDTTNIMDTPFRTGLPR